MRMPNGSAFRNVFCAVERC